MLLVVDIGNTNIEFGLFDEARLVNSFRLATKYEATSDEIGLTMMQFYAQFGISIKNVKDVVISSVVPQVMHSMTNAVIKYIGREPLVLLDNLDPGIVNLYGHPKEVGADRLATAVGAYQKYGGPLVVLSFGTATLFDAVSAKGEYLGGAIMPGIKISMEALFDRTAKLPKVELADPGVVIGKSTVQSIQSGVYNGYYGAIKNITAMMKAELGADTKIIATGGLSVMFTRGDADIVAIDRTLILDGLRFIYERHIAAHPKK